MSLQVVIADDEVLARQKLLQLLREEPDIEVVGEGANAAETIDLVQLTRPDVLLLDFACRAWMASMSSQLSVVRLR